MLESLLSYYTSYGESISNKLDAKKIECIKEDYKDSLVESFDYLRPYIKSYNYELKGITLNMDSLSLNSNMNGVWSVKVDAIVDLVTDIVLESYGGEIATDNSDSTNSAVLTMEYNKEKKQWEIAKMEYSSYRRDPSLWSNKIEYKIKNPEKYSWENEGKEGSPAI